MVNKARVVVVELTMLTEATKGVVKRKKSYDLLLEDRAGNIFHSTITKVTVK